MGIQLPEWDSRYDYIAMVMRLANDDITKTDLVYERQLIDCLNVLSYWKERDKYNEELNKRLANKGR